MFSVIERSQESNLLSSFSFLCNLRQVILYYTNSEIFSSRNYSCTPFLTVKINVPYNSCSMHVSTQIYFISRQSMGLSQCKTSSSQYELCNHYTCSNHKNFQLVWGVASAHFPYPTDLFSVQCVSQAYPINAPRCISVKDLLQNLHSWKWI